MTCHLASVFHVSPEDDQPRLFHVTGVYVNRAYLSIHTHSIPVPTASRCSHGDQVLQLTSEQLLSQVSSFCIISLL